MSRPRERFALDPDAREASSKSARTRMNGRIDAMSPVAGGHTMPAHRGKFVAYYRVTTHKQGKSGPELQVMLVIVAM